MEWKKIHAINLELLGYVSVIVMPEAIKNILVRIWNKDLVFFFTSASVIMAFLLLF